jgi:hypothetical protein
MPIVYTDDTQAQPAAPPVAATPAASPVPGGLGDVSANQSTFVDQRRGGMGGLVSLPVKQDPNLEAVQTTDNPGGHIEYQQAQRPSYDPNETFADYPQGWRPAMSFITDLSIGTLDHLSNLTGLGVDALMKGAEMARNDMAKELGATPRPSAGVSLQDGPAFMHKMLENAGFQADSSKAYNRWAADLGSDAANVATQAVMFLGGIKAGGKVGELAARASTPAADAVQLAGPLGKLSNKIGLSSPMGMAAGMTPDVPQLASQMAGSLASSAMNSVGGAVKNVGENALAHPGQVAGAVVGSQMGQYEGENSPKLQQFLKSMGADISPEMMGMIGAIIGGREGSVVGSMRRIAPASGGGFRGRPVSGGAQINAAMPGAKSLLNPAAEFSQTDVANAVNGYTNSVTNWLKNAATKVVGLKVGPNGEMPSLPSTAAQAQKLRETSKEGYDRAQALGNNEFWSQVDRSQKGPTPTALTTAADLSTRYNDPASYAQNVPDDFIKAVRSIGQTKQMALGVNSTVPKNASVGDMKDLVSTMRARANALGSAGDPSTRELRGNIIELANSLDNDLGNVNPHDMALQSARAYSNWVHKTFTNGPLGVFTDAMNSNTLNQTNAKDALTSAMGDPRFGAQLAGQTPEQLSAQGPMALPKAGQVGPNQPPSLSDVAPDLPARTGDWVKSMVADSFNQKLDPSSADYEGLTNASAAAAAMKRYMNHEDFKGLVKAFPQLDQEMSNNTAKLNEAISEGHKIRSSSFFKNAGETPDTAIERILGSPTKIRDAQNIVKQFGSKPEVMEGIQYGVIRKLGNDANWDGATMQTMLNNRDNRKVFQALLPNGGYERLNRILNASQSLKESLPGAGGSIFGSLSPIETAGRVIGSLLTGAAGGHSIQVHSIGTKIGGNIMQKLFHIIPPEDMIQKAITDPNWERFLMSRLPTTLSNIRATNRLMGTLVGVEQNANSRLMNQLSQKDNQSGPQ